MSEARTDSTAREAARDAAYAQLKLDVKNILPHILDDTDFSMLVGACEAYAQEINDAGASHKAGRVIELEAEVARLNGIINTPHTHDWLQAVPLEAAHQIERWGTEHDTGKTPFDWFWLVGYLSQKAAASAVAGDIEKAKHHTISTGACLLNWFRRLVGDDESFQPGIATPKPETIAALAEQKPDATQEG